MVAVVPVTVVVWVCVLAAAASQPFPHSQPHKQTDFRWNARRVGNKKVATLTIRRDEERDRRSIPLVDADDDSGGRSHTATDTTTARRPDQRCGWLTVLTGRLDIGKEGLIRTSRGLTPLFLAESSLEDRNSRRSRLNDVRPGASDHEERQSRIQDIFQATGFHLNPAVLKNTTRISAALRHGQRNNNRGQRRRKNGNGNRNRNNSKKRRRKPSKNCRRLKGKMKRKCRAALRKCRQLRGREKRKCRESAVNSVPQNNDNNLFNFIKGKSLMHGKDACHYRYLKECSKKVGMLSDPSGSGATLIKCHLRDEFLKCMEEQRQQTCDPAYRIRGNMTAMRKKIRDVVWTPNSCLISEAVEG